MSGFGLAFRYGVEMVSAVIVGTGIGLLIDNWLEIAPWGMIVFFFLGAAAGMLNVYRAVAGFGLAPGYKAPQGEKAQDDEVLNSGKGNDPDAGGKK
jgi:ATP synthase protein I